MSIYRRGGVTPKWEPVPWTLKGRCADALEAGFHARALKPIDWRRPDWANFPSDGLFGQSRDWLRERDVAYVASLDAEDFLLIQNSWSGWPDPPEWGLVTRPSDGSGPWVHWGHFPELPRAWNLSNPASDVQSGSP